MKILFLTDNFPPESNAPATRTYEHCMEWIKKGAEVTVITCAPNYPQGKLFEGYKNKWKQTEMMDGIKVIRIWSYITPNRGMVRRILDYMSFCVTSFFAALSVETDLIVATSPQLFTAVSGYLSSFFKRKPWIMEIRDLWPESIRAVGAMHESRLLKILDQVVLFLYRKANHIVVVTETFKLRMISIGIPGERVSIIKNGVHLHKFLSREKDLALIKKLQLENKFIVAYIGTHGMAHKLDFILDCAKKVTNKNIHFLFVGAGAMKGRLIRQAKRLALTNVTLLAPIPKDAVPNYINIADVALITLKKIDTFKKVLPSKIFENAAMKKPILLGVEGEAKALVEKYGAGLAFEPENEADFLQKLEQIYTDKKAYTEYQEGCQRLAADFDRGMLAERMYETMQSVLSKKPKLQTAKVRKGGISS